MYWKLAVLKKYFEEKIYGGLASSWGCSPVVHNSQFFQKSGAHVRPSCRSPESANIFTAKPPWWRAFFTKDLGFISAISLKRLQRRVFPAWVLHSSFFKLSKHFAAQGQPSQHNKRNTATVLRAVVKSHNGLKWQKYLPVGVLEEISKNFQNLQGRASAGVLLL